MKKGINFTEFDKFKAFAEPLNDELSKKVFNVLDEFSLTALITPFNEFIKYRFKNLENYQLLISGPVIEYAVKNFHSAIEIFKRHYPNLILKYGDSYISDDVYLFCDLITNEKTFLIPHKLPYLTMGNAYAYSKHVLLIERTNDSMKMKLYRNRIRDKVIESAKQGIINMDVCYSLYVQQRLREDIILSLYSLRDEPDTREFIKVIERVIRKVGFEDFEFDNFKFVTRGGRTIEDL